jgi:hypothetical protein
MLLRYTLPPGHLYFVGFLDIIHLRTVIFASFVLFFKFKFVLISEIGYSTNNHYTIIKLSCHFFL